MTSTTSASLETGTAHESAAAGERRSDATRIAAGLLGCAFAVLAWEWITPAYVPVTGGSRVGAMFAVGALVLLALGVRGVSKFERCAGAISIVLVCAIVDALLRRVEATYQPRVGLYSYLAGLLARAAHLDVSIEGQDLLVLDGQGLIVFSPTWGALGWRALATYSIAVGLFLAWRGGNRVLLRLTLFAGLAQVAFVLRYAWRVCSLAATDNALGNRDHSSVALLLAPEASLLALLLAVGAAGIAESWLAQSVPARPEPRRLRAGAWLPVLAGLSLGAAATFVDPGTPKAGRVTIDDRLSGLWEPAGRRLTTDRYGDFSAYSFAAMAEHLSHRYAVSIESTAAYTPERLRDVDILILKTPQVRLTREEVAAIQSWVRSGGSLFAIGDHTDLSGMATNLNELTGPLGIQFWFDATNPLVDGGFDVWTGNGVFPEHPISANLEPLELMTGCSLQLSGGARPVMTLRRSGSMRGDYSRNSYFGAVAPMPADPGGLLVVAAANQVGAGRVVAFSDSTVLSSFSYYVGPKAEFVDRAVAWLNHRASPAQWLAHIWAGLGLLAAAIALTLRSCSLVLGTGLACFGALTGAWMGGLLAHTALVPPSPDPAGTRTVGFVVQGGHVWLPAVLGSQPDVPADGNLMTFIQTPQRLGFETRLVPREPVELESLDVLVLMNPDVEQGQPEAPAGWVEAVEAWVSRGGRLVVLQRTSHLGHAHDRAPLYLPSVPFEEVASPAPEIKLRWARYGAGRVIHVLGAEALSVEAMGHCMDYPSNVQAKRYEAAYLMFGEMCGLEPLDRRTYLP